MSGTVDRPGWRHFSSSPDARRLLQHDCERRPEVEPASINHTQVLFLDQIGDIGVEVSVEMAPPALKMALLVRTQYIVDESPRTLAVLYENNAPLRPGNAHHLLKRLPRIGERAETWCTQGEQVRTRPHVCVSPYDHCNECIVRH